MFAAHMYSTILFHSGRSLELCEKRIRAYCKIISVYKHGTYGIPINCYLQSTLNFMGQSTDPLILRGSGFDEDYTLTETVKKEFFVAYITTNLNKLILAYYFNEYDVAWDMILLSRRNVGKTAKSLFSFSLRTFYDSLTCLELARNISSKSKKQSKIIAARKGLRRLRSYAANCPENFNNKVSLLEAEFAILQGHTDSAMHKYDQSIAEAEVEEFQYECALAHERKGRALMRMGDAIEGQACLLRACSLYKKWGAHAKVKQMEETVLITKKI